MTILLIRHGEYLVNEYFNGQVDGPLTELGARQAQVTARILKEMGVSALYSSDMKRTQQTAGTFGRLLGLDVLLRAELREINRGEWESENPDCIKYREFKLQWDKHEEDIPYPGGECGKDVYRRASLVIKEIISTDIGTLVVVITHGGVIRALLAGYSGQDQSKRFQWNPHLCGISKIMFENDKLTLLEIDKYDHVNKL